MKSREGWAAPGIMEQRYIATAANSDTCKYMLASVLKPPPARDECKRLGLIGVQGEGHRKAVLLVLAVLEVDGIELKLTLPGRKPSSTPCTWSGSV